MIPLFVQPDAATKLRRSATALHSDSETYGCQATANAAPDAPATLD
jgi:hypothetical protein